jgi:pyrroline-5-carboxylate reductase
MKRLGFIGAGNMARAIGAGLVRRNAGFALAASDSDRNQVTRFCQLTGGDEEPDNAALVARSEIVLIAVKPQVMPAVLSEIAPQMKASHLVISIAAGIPLAAFARALGDGTRVVRVMPNTPALIGASMSVIVGGRAATAADLDLTEQLFAAIGEVLRLDDEGLMDAVTAVSGSGPGFVFAFAEALTAAAEKVGLSPAIAVKLVEQTLYGAAALLRESDESAANLRAMVTSPGGTTLAGLNALAAAGFADAVRAAIEAAARRSRELSQG